MNKELTEEQVKDIKEREAKALEALKELELTPAAIVYKQNIGNDMFADKITPYLQDTKYAPKKDEETNTATEESVEVK